MRGLRTAGAETGGVDRSARKVRRVCREARNAAASGSAGRNFFSTDE